LLIIKPVKQEMVYNGVFNACLLTAKLMSWRNVYADWYGRQIS